MKAQGAAITKSTLSGKELYQAINGLLLDAVAKPETIRFTAEGLSVPEREGMHASVARQKRRVKFIVSIGLVKLIHDRDY